MVNGHDTEVASLKKGEWSIEVASNGGENAHATRLGQFKCEEEWSWYRGGQFNGW